MATRIYDSNTSFHEMHVDRYRNDANYQASIDILDEKKYNKEAVKQVVYQLCLMLEDKQEELTKLITRSSNIVVIPCDDPETFRSLLNKAGGQ